MTPLPKSTPPATRTMRPGNTYPMTAAQRLRWHTPRKPRPLIQEDPEHTARLIAHINGRPYLRDTVEAAGDGTPTDEVDAGYLAAVRLSPRVVGNEAGQVPLAVVDRLYDAGLIRRAEDQKTEQE